MQYIGELESTVDDGVIEVLVPASVTQLRKYHGRAHFLFYDKKGDAALPVHLEIGKGRSYRSFANKLVTGRVHSEVITDKHGVLRTILVVTPVESAEPDSCIRAVRDGNFRIDPLY